jgi:hypothetical protein
MNIFDAGFWTASRRMWVYDIAKASIPLLIALGIMTEDIASMVLLVVAAIFGVATNSMATRNIKPDNVIKVGVELNQK